MSGSGVTGAPWLWGGACLAIAAPALLAYSEPPSTTFFNQAAALAGWGVFCLVLAVHGMKELLAQSTVDARLTSRWPGGAVVAMALGLLVVLACALSAPWTSGLPFALSWSSAGLLAAALVCLFAGAWSRRGSSSVRDSAFEAVCGALMLVGALSAVIAILQFTGTVDAWYRWVREAWGVDLDVWLARPNTPGRVGGNLRQANHLSTLLLWSMAATVHLHRLWDERGCMSVTARRLVTSLVMLLLLIGAVLTVSRTGMLCVLLLMAWGVLDRGLPSYIRRLLWVLPLAYLLVWLGVGEWADQQQQAFAGDAQLNKSDLSSSRFGIWANTWALIQANPWFGVGWGEFNFAWTLTPFPGRPVAFFDHTHNLPLQLAVEIGLPLAVLVIGLWLFALWRGATQAVRQSRPAQAATRCALVMVLMVGLHSQLEYPLWYAHFLLPAAFAAGVAFGVPSEDRPGRVAAPVTGTSWGLLSVAGPLMLAGALLAVLDYGKVADIFSADESDRPLPERIERGQQSHFFRHHADYAAVTTATHPSTEMPAFASAPHFLLDARLMIAWAKAHAERGELDRARYIAQRLAEFKHPLGNAFFEPCQQEARAGVVLPFQCTPPERRWSFRDFR